MIILQNRTPIENHERKRVLQQSSMSWKRACLVWHHEFPARAVVAGEAVTAVEPPMVEPAVVAGEAVAAAEPPTVEPALVGSLAVTAAEPPMVEPAVVAGEAVAAAEPPTVEPCLWAVWSDGS